MGVPRTEDCKAGEGAGFVAYLEHRIWQRLEAFGVALWGWQGVVGVPSVEAAVQLHSLQGAGCPPLGKVPTLPVVVRSENLI